MADENNKPVVNFTVLRSVEGYVEKSGKFCTKCASFQIPGRDSGGARTVYIPYCNKQRFSFGPFLEDLRGHGGFIPPERGKPIEIMDFELFRQHFHDIHCPRPCPGYRNRKIVAVLDRVRSFKSRITGKKWTTQEKIGLVAIPVLGIVIAFVTPELRRALHLDKTDLQGNATTNATGSIINNGGVINNPTINNAAPPPNGDDSQIKAMAKTLERIEKDTANKPPPAAHNSVSMVENYPTKADLTATAEHADLRLQFVNPTKLALVVRNISKVNAFDPKYSTTLWDLDEPRNANAGTGLSLPNFTRIDRGDFIKPGYGSGPYDITDAFKATGRYADGNRTAGFAFVTCSNCSDVHYYWLYYVGGVGGWYSEIPIGQSPQMTQWTAALPQLVKDPESVFTFIPLSKRTAIETLKW
jgi:hypothetical protein